MAKPRSEALTGQNTSGQIPPRVTQEEARELFAESSSTPSDNCVEMRIPARAEWVRVVRLATAGVAARLGFSYDDIEDLKLAVAEACNNAILHGNSAIADTPESKFTSTLGSYAPIPVVTVRWVIFPNKLRISVSDQGRLDASDLTNFQTARSQSKELQSKGLQTPQSTFETARDIVVDNNELPEGGMGLLLIASLMDEVEHEFGPHSDTTLHMVKYAPLAARQADVRTTTKERSSDAGREKIRSRSRNADQSTPEKVSKLVKS